MSAKGSLLFFSSEAVVGMAFSVDRTYLGGQLACGEGVTEDYKNNQSISHQIMGDLTYIWWQDNRWWCLIQFGNVKGLTLHANVYWLQRVESHLCSRLLRLLCWLWLCTSHAHLRELLCHSLYTLLKNACRAVCGITWLWRLVRSLRRTILRLSIGWLRSRSMRVWITILRLLGHAIRRLLLLLLLTWEAIAARGCW